MQFRFFISQPRRNKSLMFNLMKHSNIREATHTFVSLPN